MSLPTQLCYTERQLASKLFPKLIWKPHTPLYYICVFAFNCFQMAHNSISLRWVHTHSQYRSWKQQEPFSQRTSSKNACPSPTAAAAVAPSHILSEEGTKVEVKRPEGPPTRSQGLEGPLTSSFNIFQKEGHRKGCPSGPFFHPYLPKNHPKITSICLNRKSNRKLQPKTIVP